MQRVRFLILPLGLCALIAVGAHASADVLGDRILWFVDRLGALFDSVFSRWSVTAPLVDWVGLEQRVWLARGLALLWELAADLLLLLPLIGYRERPPGAELALARKLFRKTARKPVPLRIVQPLCTAAVAIGGSRAVAHLLRSSLYRAPLIAHATSFTALFLLVALFATRATLRSLEHADEVAGSRGLLATLSLPSVFILVPLAIAAFA